MSAAERWFPDPPPTPGHASRYIARIPFVYGERTFKAGETFPADELEVPAWRVGAMFQCGHIVVDERKRR